jgi:hypothetical protein
VSGIDPDAAAYIALIEGDGVSVSAAQKTALSDFYATGKSEGWYSSLKRIYLPIWAAAAPNARCLVSGTSGTFVGGVDHNSPSGGWVQGDGSTGYFNLNITPSELGLSVASGYLAALITQASTAGFRGLIGSAAGSDWTVLLSSNTGQLLRWNNTSTGQVSSASNGTGIISASRSGGDRAIYQRLTSGKSTLVSVTAADFGAIPAQDFYAWSYNFGGSASDFNNARMGAIVVGSGLSSADDSLFTDALKTLWETCTGLTLA